MTDQDIVATHLRRSLDVLERAAADAEFGAAVLAIAQAVEKSLRAGGKVMLAGNGGSAADAQHIAAEMTQVQTQLDGMLVERPRRQIIRASPSRNGGSHAAGD